MIKRIGCRDERGQSLVELALMLPLFLMLVLAVLDFGRLFGTAIALQNASREGARYASMYPNPETTTVDKIKQRAIAEASATGYPGIQPQDVEVIPDHDWQDGQPVTVRMTYHFHFLTTMIFSSGTVDCVGSTTMVVAGGS